jgi:uncharacterized protein YjiS (DUF1127 family)
LQRLFYASHQINKFYLRESGAQGLAMLMRTRPPSLLRQILAAIMMRISARLAAWRRRRALAGLDARQLADIGVARVDGDYVLLANMMATASGLSCPGKINNLTRASMPSMPAKKKDVGGRDKPGHDDLL